MVLLQFLRGNSEVKRVKTVPKTRDSAHDLQIRQFEITAEGFSLGRQSQPEQSLLTTGVYGPDLPGKCLTKPEEEGAGRCRRVSGVPSVNIKQGLLERGDSEDLAEEIAARTVNKERARAGEARQASRTSIDDISSGRRGGLRSHQGPGGRTRDQLYEEARRRGIRGRSRMTKAQLESAVDH